MGPTSLLMGIEGIRDGGEKSVVLLSIGGKEF